MKRSASETGLSAIAYVCLLKSVIPETTEAYQYSNLQMFLNHPVTLAIALFRNTLALVILNY